MIINDVEYDLADGSLFLVRRNGGTLVIKQVKLKGDALGDMSTDVEQTCDDVATKDSDVWAFFSGKQTVETGNST
jgi:hypothetical protein